MLCSAYEIVNYFFSIHEGGNMTDCTMCRIFERLDGDEKDWLIAEMKTGYAVISKRWQ